MAGAEARNEVESAREASEAAEEAEVMGDWGSYIVGLSNGATIGLCIGAALAVAISRLRE